MITTFLATLHPIAILFICMAIGFILTKLNILPEQSSAVLSKLNIWVLYPALCFVTMAKYCTPSVIAKNAVNLAFALTGLALAILISFLLIGLFVKKGDPERGVYRYALTYGNSGYMGDPLVLSIFGDLTLTFYKIFTFPISLSIYTWGANIMSPKKKGKNPLLSVLNPPTVAIVLGMIVGLTGLGEHLPSVMVDTLNSLKNCMGPVVMILAGCTVAGYDLLKMLKNKKVYFITALRLVIIPALIIGILFLIKLLLSALSILPFDNTALYLVFFAVATPIGLNTIVFPKANGENAETGAAMALISHTLCVITIPLLLALMTVLFGPMTL
ncbi:MAG: AEC family transporter [Clostridia bacterium]|nr:AEC family transporter [Clostridia bacterium]